MPFIDGIGEDGEGMLPFVSAGPDKSLWGPLIEKAVAKMNGSYENIQGGIPIEGIRKLLGYPGIEYFHQELESADELWDKLVESQTVNALITSGS